MPALVQPDEQIDALELAARIGIDVRTVHDKSEGNAPWRRALRGS